MPNQGSPVTVPLPNTFPAPVNTPSLPPPQIQPEATWQVERYRPRLQVTFLGRHLDRPPINFDQQSDQDLMQVMVHKDMGEPAGSFSVTLTTRRDKDGRTWANKISPMDYVEIRLTHKADGDIPVVMRGFVTNAEETLTEVNGRPEMAVLVNGYDYGKLFIKANLFLVLNNNEILFGADAPALLFWEERWGVSGDNFYALSPSDFIEKIIDPNHGILGSFISLKDAPPMIPEVHAGEFKPVWKIPIIDSTASLGSLQNLLDAYKSNPFYEMFIDEQVDGPHLIWRLAPFVDANGKLIPMGAAVPEMPAIHDVLLRDVVHLNVGRQDDNQYSYFMTLPTFLSDSNLSARWYYGEPVEAGGAAVWRKELSEQFGFRPLQSDFPLIWLPPEQTQTDASGRAGDFTTDMIDLNRWLEAAMADQYLFENGDILLRGQPDYHVGGYLRIVETGQTFYIEAFDHSFTIDPVNYTTQLSVTRGRWPASVSPYDVIARSVNTSQFGSGTTPLGLDVPGVIAGENTGALAGPTDNLGTHLSTGQTSFGSTASSGTMIWPARGKINQPFGVPELGNANLGPHNGIDIDVPTGTTIAAATAGTVLFAGSSASQYDTTDGLGTYVVIDAGNGLNTIYGHLQSISVQAGQTVSQGQTVGISDSTGFSTGPHLHFQVNKNGVPVDPMPYLGAQP